MIPVPGVTAVVGVTVTGMTRRRSHLVVTAVPVIMLSVAVGTVVRVGRSLVVHPARIPPWGIPVYRFSFIQRSMYF